FAIELIPHKLGAATTGLAIPTWIILFAIQLVIFAGGFVIEGCALITILTPVFLPVIKSLGFDPIVFGVAFMLNLATAVITPPFAANLYVMDGILPDVPFIDIAKGSLKFMVADLIVLTAVIAFPQLSLWLPSLMK
ncbi:MAG: TRAP transporter large permease subunit, partial [Desulfatiglans sp.]|nr:TRAP transporter large permease subunit [Desulfatiglans sp.]